MSGEELLRAMQKRRSVRNYSGEPVPMEKLNMILEAGMLAPSGRAIRPWELIVIRDKQKLISLSSCRMGGSARMLAGADLAIAVLGDEEKSDVWTEDCCVVMENMHCPWACPRRTGPRRRWSHCLLERSISISTE